MSDNKQFERMFMAACSDLGAVSEALGLDPNDGGAEPILDAIEDMRRDAAMWRAYAKAYPRAAESFSAKWSDQRAGQ